MSIDKWLKSGKHMPPILRDFHDQKDIFKAMHELMDSDSCGRIGGVSWVSGQIYIIDFFLWFMARRGYTLQRCRAKQEFLSIEETVRTQAEKRNKAFSLAFGLTSKSEGEKS